MVLLIFVTEMAVIWVTIISLMNIPHAFDATASLPSRTIGTSHECLLHTRFRLRSASLSPLMPLAVTYRYRLLLYLHLRPSFATTGWSPGHRQNITVISLVIITGFTSSGHCHCRHTVF